MTTSIPTRCKCRKQNVTSLRCSRCSVPICPDCSIPAPVGMLCRECASNKKSRLYQVSASSMALATAACLVTATLGGWILVGTGFGFGFYGFIFSFVYGTIIAEVALRVTGRKRGIKMEILAGGSAGAGIIMGHLLSFLPSHVAAPAPHVFVLAQFLNPFLWISLALAVFGAVNRIRYI